MTCYTVFKVAMSRIGELPEATDTAFLTDRAAPLLLSAVYSFADSDRLYRSETGGEEQPEFDDLLSLNDDFPLSDIFLPATAARLAAMLIIGENRELAENMTKESEEERARILSSIPGKAGAVTQKYGE